MIGVPLLELARESFIIEYVDEARIFNDRLGTVSDAGEVLALTDLINLIKSHIVMMDRLKVEISERRQMLNDAYLNDPVYREQDEKVKEVAKVRNATKMQIMKQPGLMEQAEKLKELTESFKEAKESLSNYLQDYAAQSGQKQIEDEKGDVREIRYEAKLVKTRGSKAS